MRYVEPLNKLMYNDDRPAVVVPEIIRIGHELRSVRLHAMSMPVESGRMIQVDVKALVYQKRKEIEIIARKHGVIKIQLFGSVARGNETSSSDIDFLVAFKEDRSLFDLIALKYDLEDLLGIQVDVVTEESLHVRIRDQVISEVVEI